jgi:hypothetical protein
MTQKDYNQVPAGESLDQLPESSNGEQSEELPAETTTTTTESSQLVKPGRADEVITVDDAIGMYSTVDYHDTFLFAAEILPCTHTVCARYMKL